MLTIGTGGSMIGYLVEVDGVFSGDDIFDSASRFLISHLGQVFGIRTSV